MPHSAPVALNLLDPHSLLASAGALGIFLVLFAETGLLVGFFLPGDSLLFTAGLLCATGGGSAVHLSLPPCWPPPWPGRWPARRLASSSGARAGRALLARPEGSRLRRGTAAAQRAIDRYGAPRAIVLARFIPVVRTVMNPLAGAIGVPARTFTVWQVAGGVAWSAGVTLAGYALGSRIPGIDRYLLPVIAVVVAVSLIPVGLEIRRQRRDRRATPDPEETS